MSFNETILAVALGIILAEVISIFIKHSVLFLYERSGKIRMKKKHRLRRENKS